MMKTLDEGWILIIPKEDRFSFHLTLALGEPEAPWSIFTTLGGKRCLVFSRLSDYKEFIERSSLDVVSSVSPQRVEVFELGYIPSGTRIGDILDAIAKVARKALSPDVS